MTFLTHKRAPFNIPAINNEKEALAIVLGVDSNVDEEFAKIESRGEFGKVGRRVKTFNFNGTLYAVAHIGVGLDTTRTVSFNSSRWNIREIDPKSPYRRFTDDVVLAQLRKALSAERQLLEIDQDAQKVIIKTSAGLREVHRYTAHLPDDIETYYFLGLVERLSS